ncbi:hypothetical protein DB324_05520 [Limosilactobacillus reuteri]|uniref:Uncharacterized protein n=1 Tax=Limosilactobacillus reuteri TaxID=1598 RepID=A0ABD6XBR1_LIMRT|nr:hypothetical protein [Limosilactobacillus reuteri]PEG79174.1 hypothetical protein CP369_06940 [Lactobacillus sp. UMNPBX18]PEG89213.1 hypothetical protein CP364_03280 [Lactobacillus sp. UMNPBX13]PEG95067.1 hypothetical protein CP361_02990 [Lactobacillus sp. UMNPBX10]PEH00309.1 hypothetical protein CP358_07380 [Lactobacillus sp. UMNPBX7]PEH08940.1 hypothetical protein CP354_00890 [Lactobacillus sp. UMNPBX3]
MMISTAWADYPSYLDSSLVVIFYVIFLLFIKVVEDDELFKKFIIRFLFWTRSFFPASILDFGFKLFIHNWRFIPHFYKWGMNRPLKAR